MSGQCSAAQYTGDPAAEELKFSQQLAAAEYWERRVRSARSEGEIPIADFSGLVWPRVMR